MFRQFNNLLWKDWMASAWIHKNANFILLGFMWVLLLQSSIPESVPDLDSLKCCKRLSIVSVVSSRSCWPQMQHVSLVFAMFRHCTTSTPLSWIARCILLLQFCASLRFLHFWNTPFWCVAGAKVCFLWGKRGANLCRKWVFYSLVISLGRSGIFWRKLAFSLLMADRRMTWTRKTAISNALLVFGH